MNDKPKPTERIICTCNGCANLYFVPTNEDAPLCPIDEHQLTPTTIEYTQLTITAYVDFCVKCNRLYKIRLEHPYPCTNCDTEKRTRITPAMIP